MGVSTTLSRYVGRHFIISCLSVFGLLATLAFVIDLVEMLRRSSSKAEATFHVVLSMSLLKLPNISEHLMPFSVLFGGMIAFARLARSREVIVMRSAGVSVWQFLLPVIAIAFAIGVFKVTVYNPIAAVTLSKFEQLENKYLKGRSSLLAVSPAGVWLRQADAYGQSVVHARNVAPRDMEMHDFIIFLYDTQNRFVGRIDAAKAKLESGYWHLYDAWITGPDRPARHENEYLVRTDLTVAKIQESFATPASISFWEMPRFIRLLENAGFSGLRHRIYWYAKLADPALLCAMVIFSAVFTLRMNLRRGVPVMMIGGGLATGFALYFLSDVVFALGASSSVPMMLAAWSPAGASLLVGISMLLYSEEG